jgi:hypothetical protein
MEENEKTVLGTWQIYANAKTSNGTLQQKETFQVAWPLQITSINFSNSKDQKQNMFAPGDFAKAILTLNSSFAQNGNIDLNVLDGTGNIINETQMQNISFNANSDNRVVYEFKIPADASPGTATLNVDTISGSYQEIKIMSAQNKTAYFMIGNNTASIPTPTATPTAPPPIENTMSLFSWVLVATGFFTFTTLFMFLKRKPMPKINVQKPQSPSPTLSQNMTTPPAPPSPQELTTPQSSTTEIALEKITNSALKTQLPSIYEKLEIPTLESISSQDQKQIIINQLAKISSTSQRLQGIESELIIEKEQLNKEITDLNKTLEEQEKVMKNYFDTIRKEIAKITPNLNGKQDIQEKKPTQQPDKKDDAN